MRLAIALAIALCLPVPSRAGLFDWMRLPSSQSEVEAPVAEARIKQYLEEVLGVRTLTVKQGHGPMTPAEAKALDNHITSRLNRASSMVTARIEAEGVSGYAVLAGANVAAEGWDPSKGYLAYLQLDTALVFPADADRAYSLTAHLLGEQPLFGFAPEAGPLWKVTERYLQQNASSGVGGIGGVGQLNAGDPVPYVAQSGEESPSDDDIPAWVVRGLTDLKWKQSKPVEMGLLLALTRRPASTCVRLTHVTGVGGLGKSLFKDARRLTEPEE